jgi:hypothetical protein
MAGPEPWGEAAQWYSDVVALGDTQRAWQAEFDRLGIRLRVQPQRRPNPHRTATVENGERRADLLLSPWKRQFWLSLCTGATKMLQGHSPAR